MTIKHTISRLAGAALAEAVKSLEETRAAQVGPGTYSASWEAQHKAALATYHDSV